MAIQARGVRDVAGAGKIQRRRWTASLAGRDPEFLMHRALSPVLIGREAELGDLEDALLAASRGDASVVLVAGEAGMGKTRMADELMVRARKIGFEVLTGACSEAELSLPSLPFVEAVGNYLARADLEPLRERLGTSSRELGRLFPRLAGSEAQVY